MNTYTVTFQILDEEKQQIEVQAKTAEEATLSAMETINDELVDIYDPIPAIQIDSVELVAP